MKTGIEKFASPTDIIRSHPRVILEIPYARDVAANEEYAVVASQTASGVVRLLLSPI